MATQPRFNNDGNWTAGFNVGCDKVIYPFLNYPNSDTNTKMFEVARAFLPLNYVPGTMLSNYASNPNTYLVMESDMAIDQMARARNTRIYSMVPPVQTSYPGSRYIPLPSINNSYGTTGALSTTTYPLISTIGSSYFDVASLAVYSSYNNSLFGPMKALGARTIGQATGGTFTLTYGASTTAALNYNDSNATIKTAIDGLASVSAAGLTSSVLNDLNNGTTGGTLTIAWTGPATFTPLTMNAGSLTVTTSTNTTTQITSSASQTIRLSDNYPATSHGLSASLKLMRISSTETAQVVSDGSWGVIDANTIWMSNSGTGFYYTYAGTLNRAYVPGQTYLLRTRVIETYYLPGISPGISTPGDILSPVGLQNPSDFISALISLTGFQSYQSEGPASWMGTQIYVVKSIEINLDDLT